MEDVNIYQVDKYTQVLHDGTKNSRVLLYFHIANKEGWLLGSLTSNRGLGPMGGGNYVEQQDEFSFSMGLPRPHGGL